MSMYNGIDKINFHYESHSENDVEEIKGLNNFLKKNNIFPEDIIKVEKIFNESFEIWYRIRGKEKKKAKYDCCVNCIYQNDYHSPEKAIEKCFNCNGRNNFEFKFINYNW